MKKLFTLILVNLLFTAFAQKSSVETNFEIKESTIYLTNGTQVTGELDYPINSAEKKIAIKVAGEKTKYKTIDIDKIVIKTSTKDLIYRSVFEYSNPLRRKGFGSNKILLLEIIVGKVTLLSGNISGNRNLGPGNSSSFYSQLNYYVVREGEEAVSCIYASGFVNPNSLFRQVGRDYFKDNPTIAKKIDDKVYTYENIVETIMEYNK
jgi:hypothetical protein